MFFFSFFLSEPLGAVFKLLVGIPRTENQNCTLPRCRTFHSVSFFWAHGLSKRSHIVVQKFAVSQSLLGLSTFHLAKIFLLDHLTNSLLRGAAFIEA